MNIRYPTAEEHLTFLVKLQRLLAEGDFTATYKFALLIALTDIAVEVGHDDDRTLDVSMRAIAEKFIDYYWQQTVPYSVGQPETTIEVLHQNNGSAAKVITDIQAFRRQHGINSLALAKRRVDFSGLVTSVAVTVAAQPVNYLQNLGGTTDNFIFERIQRGLRLNPGVSSHLRKFHSLIQEIARNRWVEHIKRNKRNHPILGQRDDLHGFLFETSPQSLQLIGMGMTKLFAGRCFYCHHSIQGSPDVDHFIPYSMYGRDIGQNFVIAHPSCNRSKSDTLAAGQHLERWLERVEKHRDDITEITSNAGVLDDEIAIMSVARWAYQSGYEAGASAWVRQRIYERISEGDVRMLRVA